MSSSLEVCFLATLVCFTLAVTRIQGSEDHGQLAPSWFDLPTYDVDCGSQLVPVNEEVTGGCLPLESPDYNEYHPTTENDTLDYNSPSSQDPGVPVFNPTTGECLYVESSYLFRCVICQFGVVGFPYSRYPQGHDDLTQSFYFVARVTSTDVRSSTADVNKTALIDELEVVLKPLSYNTAMNRTERHRQFGDLIKFNHSRLSESGHLQVDFLVESPISASAARENATTGLLQDTFTLWLEDVGFCPGEKLLQGDGSEILWPKTLTYFFEFRKKPRSGDILRRVCLFDKEHSFQAKWESEPSQWQLVWRPCDSVDDKYRNEEVYKQVLDVADIDSRHANVLHDFTTAPVNGTALQEVARLVGRELAVKNELDEQIILDLVTVTANLKMDTDQHVVVAMKERAYLVVVDSDPADPVIGFALHGNVTGYNASESITVDRAPEPQSRHATTPLAVDVTPRLVADNKRVAFLAVWKHMQMLFDDVRVAQYLEVSVMFPLGHVSAWTFMSYGNYYVDITYFPDQFYGSYGDSMPGFANSLVCIAWNNDLQAWVNRGCRALYFERNGTTACRCGGKYFALRNGVPIAKYALKKELLFNIDYGPERNDHADFLEGKILLKIATALECLLCLFGLGSIVSTAIRFKHWRENKGHKILLHMLLALTCNLVLGFTASYVRMTTESVGCLVYGVLRHYSFLAMFLWMLVLSCLQLKRLTTVVGAKATSHLIIKVSLFAWGLPLLPITILLGVNPGFYQMDRFDRGYCYPERLVFHLTVQGPAGLILFVNLGIFIKIVLHIFELIGEKKITRHSKGKRAEQLNKLKTSLFIFFLFGFSWVFHILSEERVIVSDFLYEFLFLMTATTHIFVLSLFFVVFQENTRKEWIKLLKPFFNKISFPTKLRSNT